MSRVFKHMISPLIFFQAVARHSCMELLNVHEAELKSEIVNNGDATMKSKLRSLDHINKLLAHRPWAIKKHHIKVQVEKANSAGLSIDSTCRICFFNL